VDKLLPLVQLLNSIPYQSVINVVGFVGSKDVAITRLRIGMNRLQKLVRAAVATVIVLTVGLSNVWAQDFKSDLPKCKGKYSSSWSNCYGRQKFINGSYEGEFKDALYNGKGIFKLDSGEKYVGSFKDMLKNGQGTLTWADGTEFKGEWKNNQLNGFGTFLFQVGENHAGYTGYWKNGAYDGLGIKITSDGNRYEGLWSNGTLVRNEQVYFAEQASKLIKNKIVSRMEDDPYKSEANPNKLPLCPKPEFSKRIDVGVGGRTGKWHNCWGKYRVELDKDHKGDVLESEWRNGLQHGWGKYIYANSDQYVGDHKDGKSHGQGTYSYANGDRYVGEYKNDQKHGLGTYTFADGDLYVGEHKDGKRHGFGTYTFADGQKYIGEFKDGKKHGLGMMSLVSGSWHYGEWQDDLRSGRGINKSSDGKKIEGIWENGNLIREVKVNLPALDNNRIINTERVDIDRERQQLAEERRRLEEEKRQREQARSSQRINLQVTHSQPNADGSFFIEIKTNADTSSLQIDGKEEGGKADGSYVIKRMARAGQESSFRIVATDVYGNTDTKTINVSRAIVESKTTYAALNPGQVKQQTTRDAVAVIIGIADYKSLPKADFASDDARAFYDYASRALGIKTENIKLLVDSDAEEVEILRTFRNWLPSKVRSTTDVYVFYSGHGLPTADGQDLYLIPPRAAKDLIDDTAIPFSKINAAIQAAKPKSVTMILDACYSGQARSGETLVASARPVRIKTESKLFPENFIVITASQNDQISSSNPDLQHGIFSYYLMKGMEGDADSNKDGKITLGEMQTYLVENVGRQAGMMNRKQEPQLVGDVNRVLVGR
jgi:hypothetical protein